MASETAKKQHNNDETAEERKIQEQQIQQLVIRMSDIQKEQHRRIRKIASGQSKGEESGRDFVLSIAIQSLQEELRNAKSAKAYSLRQSK